MRKPAKKYFSPSFGTQSIMMIRKWIASGATPVDITRWIKMEYAKAKDDATRRHLGMMMCAAMSASETYQGSLLAKKCADMFGISPARGRALGEAAFLAMSEIYGCKNTVWLDNFNSYFANCCSLPSEIAPKTVVTKALSSYDHTNLVPVDSRNSVYFMRDSEGKAWLIAINNRNTDILIDEETFGREPALYFTESDHFISPVWIIKQVAAILEYILRKIGYPPLHIFKKVIFEASGANLINEDTYRESEEWKGVEVVTLNKTSTKVFAAPPIPIVDIDRTTQEADQELCVMLYISVMATKEILDSFRITEHWEITDSLIEEWCTKTSLFKSDNWDLILHDDLDDD